jgi:hypothetical protein
MPTRLRSTPFLPALLTLACGSSGSSGLFTQDGGAGSSAGGSGGRAGSASAGSAGSDAGGGGGLPGSGGQSGSGGAVSTCERAAQEKGYLGCEFWPTVTSNLVWSIFDFAVVVVNGGSEIADVSVERDGSVVTSGQVHPASAGKFYLPWVEELKGKDSDQCGSASASTGSVIARGGGYRLESSVPVAVYQFSPIEYAAKGGPPGKSWAGCPAERCTTPGLGCFSYSNDASLLFPTSSLGTSYRVASLPGWNSASIHPFLSIAATADGTNVNIQAAGALAAGEGIAATAAGETIALELNRGDVVQLEGSPDGDFSGSLVVANRPLQVLSGIACVNVPIDAKACDHLEASLPPAPALGRRYLVAQPSVPLGGTAGHVVRFYGHRDGTKLTYPSGAPTGAPSQLDAGQVVLLGTISQDFEVVGDKPFAVGSFMLGGSVQDPAGALGGESKGDPAFSLAVPVEQFRTSYLFFAAEDFEISYVNIVHPAGAILTLDGAPIEGAIAPIGSGHSVLRAKIDGGLHRLESTLPAGVQVMSFGKYSSVYYPAGANFEPL